MKLRKPWMIKLGAQVGAITLRAWMMTVRARVDTLGQLTDPRDPHVHEKFIYALWHEHLAAVPALYSVAPVTALISQSADGELLSRVCRANGLNTVRGSSSQGAVEAVDDLLALSEKSHLLIAPDGPRGPRREVKRGLTYLASWTKMRVVPLGIAFSRAWRVNSWDRTALPFPGSMISLVAGPIVEVAQGLGKSAMEQHRRLIEERMLTATAVAEAWSDGRTPTAQWPADQAVAA